MCSAVGGAASAYARTECGPEDTATSEAEPHTRLICSAVGGAASLVMSEMVVALRSVVTYVVIIAYIAVAGPLGLFIAVVFRWKHGLYALGHAGVSLALALAGIRYRVVGRAHVPPSAVVFCSNHESNVDPPVLFMTLHPYLHILYKAELRQFPIMRTVLDVGGFVPIERADREKAAESIARGAESLRAGNSFLIFPEGTRSRTGQLLPFKKGGFIMAIRAQVPVVPVSVQGGRAAMRRGSTLVRPVRVSVRIGRPIPTTGLTTENRDELIAKVREEIEALRKQGSLWS